MAIKIAFVNQKGGVGKTTTTMQFMAYLMEKGKKVLGIDLDPQGNFTFNCGVNTDGENTMSELLTKECTFSECVKKTRYGDILPSDLALAGREREISGKPGSELILRTALKNFEKNYEYILIDCPPALNTFTYNGLLLANEICIVMQAETFATTGVGQLLEVLNEIRDSFEKDLHIAGMIITMYQGRLNITKGIIEMLEEAARQNGFKVFKNKVGKSVKIPEAQAAQLSVFDYDGTGKTSKEYRLVFAELEAAVSSGGR